MQINIFNVGLVWIVLCYLSLCYLHSYDQTNTFCYTLLKIVCPQRWRKQEMDGLTHCIIMFVATQQLRNNKTDH